MQLPTKEENERADSENGAPAFEMHREDSEDDASWTKRAGQLAEFAHKQCFSIRRSVQARGGTVAYWDNNPVGDSRSLALAAITDELATLEIATLGVGSYPKDGADAGYTAAMIFEAGEPQEELVLEVIRKHLLARGLGGHFGMHIS